MADYVLSLPASGTFNIINQHLVHAFPHPRSYRYDQFITFRKKGSSMTNLYSVQREIIFDPNADIESAIKHLGEDEKFRIHAYIKDRKKGFGFERHNYPYMFWFLKLEEPLQHSPKPAYGYSSHIYFLYKEITNGNKIVSIASK